jgi:hypothetical protein
MSIKRADGVTESECYLKHLCDRTFLSLWSYPGIYRDQDLSKKTEGKEVCDLLVVFENHIIIFSDKDCQFPNSDRLEIDWNRWFKKTVQKSADQVWGAERWIGQHRNRLFLDRSCTSPFPIDIPDLSTAKFHLIVVAHGNSIRCQQELQGSGSLMINSSIKGAVNHYMGENGGIPFCIGDIDPNRTFVHVLDDTSLDIVLNTLDTISDFVSYLDKKEKLLRSDTTVFAAGEEDLLAYYLLHMNENDEHDFVIPSNENEQINYLFFDEGYWEEFTESPERKAQILADRISYAWDMLIEEFSDHVMEGTEYFTTDAGIQGTEPLLRFLARESRFRRRNLVAGLIGIIQSAPRNMRATRYLCASSHKEPYYVFLTLPECDSMAYDEYREKRRFLLEACCSSVKLKYPDAQHIIGIATEPGIENGGRSHDAIYLDVTNWTEQDDIWAREVAEAFDILKNPNKFTILDREYPIQEPTRE